jgi:hypothetical protein
MGVVIGVMVDLVGVRRPWRISKGGQDGDGRHDRIDGVNQAKDDHHQQHPRCDVFIWNVCPRAVGAV